MPNNMCGAQPVNLTTNFFFCLISSSHFAMCVYFGWGGIEFLNGRTPRFFLFLSPEFCWGTYYFMMAPFPPSQRRTTAETITCFKSFWVPVCQVLKRIGDVPRCATAISTTVREKKKKSLFCPAVVVSFAKRCVDKKKRRKSRRRRRKIFSWGRWVWLSLRNAAARYDPKENGYVLQEGGWRWWHH